MTSEVTAEVIERFRESVRASPDLNDEARAHDVLRRLAASGRWTAVWGTGRGSRHISAARVERLAAVDGLVLSMSLTGPWVLERVRELRRRLCCTRCGQIRP